MRRNDQKLNDAIEIGNRLLDSTIREELGLDGIYKNVNKEGLYAALIKEGCEWDALERKWIEPWCPGLLLIAIMERDGYYEVYEYTDWEMWKSPYARCASLRQAYQYVRQAGYPPASIELGVDQYGDTLRNPRLFQKTLPPFSTGWKVVPCR